MYVCFIFLFVCALCTVVFFLFKDQQGMLDEYSVSEQNRTFRVNLSRLCMFIEQISHNYSACSVVFLIHCACRDLLVYEHIQQWELSLLHPCQLCYKTDFWGRNDEMLKHENTKHYLLLKTKQNIGPFKLKNSAK